MEHSSFTARQMFEHLLLQADRPQYTFGTKPMLINVDLQNAYTRPNQYFIAYEDNTG